MADVEEEGNLSEYKNDDTFNNNRGKPFSAMHQEFENKLSKSGTSYADRVSIVLSGWDHLAGSASVGQFPFATLLHKWTLQLVLQGDWPKLEKIVKTRLKATLQRCCRDPILDPMCKVLLPLVTDPWGNPILKAIIGGSAISDDDAEKYLHEETWEVVKVRIDTMVESRCEELALSVLKVCMRCIQLRSSRDPEFALYSNQDHNHFVDLYFVLLYKYERNKFREELKNKDLDEGIDFVRRLLSQQEKAKVWKHRLKIAETAIQIFLTSCIVKPYGGNFWSVFTVWCDVMIAIETGSEKLDQMAQKFIQLAESSQHIYNMASIFHHKFGSGHAALVTELLIRALTLDMNSLERVKSDTDENKDEQIRLEHQMAAGFMDLAAVFDAHRCVARECVLTSFSLHPTIMRLDKIKQFAECSSLETPSGNSAVPSILPINEENSSTQTDTAIKSEDSNSCFDVQSNQNSQEYSRQNPEPKSDDYLLENSKPHEIRLEPKPPEIKVDTGQVGETIVGGNLQDLKSNATKQSRDGSLNISQYAEGSSLAISLNVQDIKKEEGVSLPTDNYCSRVHNISTEKVSSDDKLPSDIFDKGKDDLDSMDSFLATTEDLIHQLNKDTMVCIKETTNIDVLTAPQAVLNDKILGISKELCDDLAVVLSSPRWQVLSWMLNKDELFSICEKYMRDSDSAKNLTKELKFLNIDYNLFRHLPSEDSDSNTGIEKGYEHFVEEDSDQEVYCEGVAYSSSSGSDLDNLPKRRGNKQFPKKIKPTTKIKHGGSDSDHFGCLRGKLYTTSYSDSDSDFDGRGRQFGIKTEKGFEGKRVTAPSSNDRCKRLKVDAATGRVRSSKEHSSHLRLYRHNFPRASYPPPDIQRVVSSPSVSTSNTSSTSTVVHRDKPHENFPRTYTSGSSIQELKNAVNKPVLAHQDLKSTSPASKVSFKHRDQELPPRTYAGPTSKQALKYPVKSPPLNYHNLANSFPQSDFNKSSNQSISNINKIPNHLSPFITSAKVQPPPTTSCESRHYLNNHSNLPNRPAPLPTIPSRPHNPSNVYKPPNQHSNLQSPNLNTSSNNFSGAKFFNTSHEANNESFKPAKQDPNKHFIIDIRDKIRPIESVGSNPTEKNWKYSGYLDVSSQPAKIPNSETSSSALGCSYRTKEGRVVNLNTHPNLGKKAPNLITKYKGFHNPSRFEQSYEEFLMKQNTQLKEGIKPSVTITRRHVAIKSSPDVLKGRNSSENISKQSTTTALANAQKDVLNRIMSPEHSRNQMPPVQPIRAIAMPVSHNPPNLPPDKGSPANLSRVLPKGTTVVRRPKSDSGAGPSGLNNGGTGMSVIRNQGSLPPSSRPTVSITPSSSFLISNSSDNYLGNSMPVRSNFIRTSSQLSPSTQEDINSPSQQETFQALTGPSPPLASATVVGSVSQIIGSRVNSLSNSPRETLGGSNVQTREVALSSGRVVSFTNRSQGSNAPTTTTVAPLLGEQQRAPSMLESLLRDRSPSSPIVPLSTGPSLSDITLSGNLISSPPTTGNTNLPESVNLATSHSSPPISIVCNVTTTPTSSTSMVFSDIDSRSLVVNASSTNSLTTTSPMLGVNSMGVPVVSNLSTSVLPSSLPGTVIGSTVPTQTSGTTPSTSVATTESSNMQQVLLPAQLIQVQGSDGSTGLGIVHSGSLDLRLPPGTRVIKSPTAGIRSAAPVAMSQPNSRQVNLLHNVKIVQNRQIVRTVVVPHSVALQNLGSQQSAQLVAISQSSGSSNNSVEIPSTSRIQPSQLHKMLGTNMVPGGLVIRAVRPQTPSNEVSLDEGSAIKPMLQATHIRHTSQSVVGHSDKEKELEKHKVIQTPPLEEGLGERLTRHYLKSALLTSTSTQSVGTQTQTTAVKPVTGQIVNQAMMNPLRGVPASSVNNLPPTNNVNTLSLTHSNAVSSETLEQLREFESVFEKVSNKSGKESDSDSNQQNFNSSGISSEESMIAAQLLSMANETPVTTCASNFVTSVNSTSTSPETSHISHSSSPPTTTNSIVNTATGVGSRLGENTFITIPCTTQAGTLILVNPSVATSGLVTMAGSNAPPSQPPPPASPALSSTSSHSSVASSPSSTSSKSKKPSSSSSSSKPKVSPTTASPSKPKTPPLPKAPPKPAVAKPQVEESDETKARIQAILDKYKQDLANTPQPQPAPRNRKNCPPPKSEGKSSSKKKSQLKKSDSGPSPSPQASDSSHLHSLSASPAPLATSVIGEDSEGSACSSSLSSTQLQEEKKSDDATTPQILQGVVVSNVKVDNSNLNPNVAGLAGGRVFQLIRHGNKVTAITTQQPYSKVKPSLAQGGPPPNVTIQGRINMSDLMENHIASLLAGNSTVNQGSSIIGKLLQSQQLQASNVQQVVVQTSDQDNQPFVQQFSLQPVLTAKSQNVHTKANIVTEANSPLLSSPLKTTSSARASPSLPAGVTASPETPQNRSVTPQTPASTPSPFPPQDDDSNSSEQSNDSTPSGPLPPFFTLTKQFMLPTQNQQFTDKSLRKNFTRTASSQPSGMSADHIQKDCSLDNPSSASSNLQPSTSSFNRASLNEKNEQSLDEESKIDRTINENNMLVHSNPNSPSMVVKVRDSILDMSPTSCPSSLENSPAVVTQRVLSQGATSDVRSNSMDSVKSDLSVEEVQIPPSPATLTKQLQNAYMTEAALSPVVSQAQLSSNSAFSSPATVQDLHFVESHGEHRDLSPGISSTSHNYSLTGRGATTSSATLGGINNVSGLPSNESLEGSGLACLSSGDVYLDQAGVSLGLDALPLEGRTQSPSLSDLVPAVPLLSWSPRSGDSLMGQSPSLNEALSSNIALEVHPSEDSLCDSSTGFPALFSIEGDGASVSSSTSEDLPSTTPISTSTTNVNIFSNPISSAPSPLSIHPEPSSSRRTYSRINKESTSSREQDQTVSSTHSDDDDQADSIGLPDMASSNGNCNDSPAASIHNWKFDVSDGNKSSDIPSEGDVESRDSEDSKDSLEQKPDEKENQEGLSSPLKESAENESALSQPRRSQRQADAQDKKSSKSKSSHNGFEGQEDQNTNHDQSFEVKVLRSKKYSSSSPSPSRSSSGKSENKHGTLSDLISDEKPSDSKQVNANLKKEPKSELVEEVTTRLTRGLKRRSEGTPTQDDKKTKPNLGENEIKTEDTKSSFDDCDVAPLKSLRNRNISGTSDSSSNYSIDRVSTPTLLDSPLGSGSGGTTSQRRRRRRPSHDSSISSRDGSPLSVIQTTPQHDPSSNTGMNTRRASSRDHAKKTRCACCTDTQQQTSQSSSSRRLSGRASKGSGPSNS